MRLLERKPAKRLGMLAGKAADVKRHKWFDGFDWAGLEARRLIPPRKPKVCLVVNRQGWAAWLCTAIGGLVLHQSRNIMSLAGIMIQPAVALGAVLSAR